MDEVVRTERHGTVALITLNRPKARNAINVELASAFVESVERSQDAALIVVTGADPAFCSGVDLRNPGVSRLTDLPRCAHVVHESAIPVLGGSTGRR